MDINPWPYRHPCSIRADSGGLELPAPAGAELPLTHIQFNILSLSSTSTSSKLIITTDSDFRGVHGSNSKHHHLINDIMDDNQNLDYLTGSKTVDKKNNVNSGLDCQKVILES